MLTLRSTDCFKFFCYTRKSSFSTMLSYSKGGVRMVYSFDDGTESGCESNSLLVNSHSLNTSQQVPKQVDSASVSATLAVTGKKDDQITQQVPKQADSASVSTTLPVTGKIDDQITQQFPKEADSASVSSTLPAVSKSTRATDDYRIKASDLPDNYFDDLLDIMNMQPQIQQEDISPEDAAQSSALPEETPAVVKIIDLPIKKENLSDCMENSDVVCPEANTKNASENQILLGDEYHAASIKTVTFKKIKINMKENQRPSLSCENNPPVVTQNTILDEDKLVKFVEDLLSPASAACSSRSPPSTPSPTSQSKITTQTANKYGNISKSNLPSKEENQSNSERAAKVISSNRQSIAKGINTQIPTHQNRLLPSQPFPYAAQRPLLPFAPVQPRPLSPPHLYGQPLPIVHHNTMHRWPHPPRPLPPIMMPYFDPNLPNPCHRPQNIPTTTSTVIREEKEIRTMDARNLVDVMKVSKAQGTKTATKVNTNGRLCFKCSHPLASKENGPEKKMSEMETQTYCEDELTSSNAPVVKTFQTIATQTEKCIRKDVDDPPVSSVEVQTEVSSSLFAHKGKNVPDVDPKSYTINKSKQVDRRVKNKEYETFSFLTEAAMLQNEKNMRGNDDLDEDASSKVKKTQMSEKLVTTNVKMEKSDPVESSGADKTEIGATLRMKKKNSNLKRSASLDASEAVPPQAKRANKTDRTGTTIANSETETSKSKKTLKFPSHNPNMGSIRGKSTRGKNQIRGYANERSRGFHPMRGHYVSRCSDYYKYGNANFRPRSKSKRYAWEMQNLDIKLHD
ncbi:uncharacterized protein LOC135940487 isoform X2 [Cloeon dipterum]|uniref:uncharacterized protein LOC135940487 isoform X2 n=1 Tax=Cloeon dipterum TaxID=197152 RepID=UPI0032200A03